MQNLRPPCRIDLSQVADILEKHQLLIKASENPPTGTGFLIVDSRCVKPNDCFIALQGNTNDGHEFLPKAISQGAGLLIVESLENLPDPNIPYCLVKDSRSAWTYLAAHCFEEPQKKLTILAVTGTNGKTSTVWILGQILRACGYPCVTIGTLGADFGDSIQETGFTTPDPDYLFSILKKAVDQGFRYVAMEASSHAIAQKKLEPLRFSAAAFTSFSRDHLDFHKSLEDYFSAKKTLFTELCKEDARFVFCDSLPNLDQLLNLGKDSWCYGFSSEGKSRHFLQLDAVSNNMDESTHLSWHSKKQHGSWKLPYFGSHALENFCAAFLLADSVIPLSFDDFLKLEQVPGRLERVANSLQGPVVIVDYAHTPDALEKTLRILRPLCQGELSVVFGCGGNRDRGKRPLMGAVAEALADHVYLTSDNPRFENPGEIISEILTGLQHPEQAKIYIDREQAILAAISTAKSCDLVLIAGKGHETVQILGDQKIPFDDRLVAKKALVKPS